MTYNIEGVVFYVRTTSGLQVSPAADPSELWDGAWHYIVGTYDGTRIRFHIDGIEKGSGTAAFGTIRSGWPTSELLLIGDYGYESNFNYSFPGNIDRYRHSEL